MVILSYGNQILRASALLPNRSKVDLSYTFSTNRQLKGTPDWRKRLKSCRLAANLEPHECVGLNIRWTVYSSDGLPVG